MTPTLRIGDLTVVEPVRASNVQPGQIVTRPPSAQWGESLTHRVRVVRAVGGGLEVTTQGDANPESETWRVSRAAWLGRSVWSVPAVGAPTLLLRSAWLRWGLGVVSVAAAVWFARRRPISSRRASVAS